MSDAELAAAIAEAGGRVFIGFKDPGAAAGVDEQGRVLVSDSVVAAAKTWLRSLGVTIESDLPSEPAVVALMQVSLVRPIRHNPVVEYVEPIFPGTFHHEVWSGTHQMRDASNDGSRRLRTAPWGTRR